jgi:hypothetical protein
MEKQCPMGTVGHSCNQNTKEAEAGGFQVWDQACLGFLGRYKQNQQKSKYMQSIRDTLRNSDSDTKRLQEWKKIYWDIVVTVRELNIRQNRS